MTIGSIIGGGIRLVRTQPQTVLIWAALYFAAIMVMLIAMRPFYADIAAMQQQAAINAAAGIKAAPPFDGRLVGFIVVLELIFFLVGIVAVAAVVRATVGSGSDRFAYLRAGMDELRLLGLAILLVLAAIVLEIAAIVAVLLIAMLARGVAGDTAGVIVAVILWLGVILAVVWAEVRISLAVPLTVLRKRIVIREAWRATRGRFWTLFGAYLLMGIAFTIVMVCYLAITNPGLITAYARFDQQAMNAAAQAQLARQGAGLTIGVIVQAIVGSIVFVAIGAVTIGAMTTAAIEADPLSGNRATAA